MDETTGNLTSFMDGLDDDCVDECGDSDDDSIDSNSDPLVILVQTVFELAGIPLMGGMVLLLFCMVFFALAIHYDWINDLAPRASNRPKAILKNAILKNVPEKYKGKIYVYPFAWIIWAYNLTYKECLAGIPGTGTRKDGWEGPLLKTNLDAIILLKYHTLLFKIGVLITFLCCVLLPMNVYTGCDVEVFGLGTCSERNRTGFGLTTIANIPDKIYNNNKNQSFSVSLNSGDLFAAINPLVQSESLTVTDGNSSYSIDNSTDPSNNPRIMTELWVPGQTLPIFFTLICCLCIYVYTIYLLTLEWIENVALRRAFFLEKSHYGQRMIELNKLELDFATKKIKNDGYDDNNHYRQDESDTLPPYLPHPEIRDTPPSIGLYSVLYQLPNSMVTYDTNGATAVERQLVAATKFFDGIVPAQPGFSSSVVAVTMIPDAKLVARAWMKWNRCEKKLQTLRYIRKNIAKDQKKKGYIIDVKKGKMESRFLKQAEQIIPHRSSLVDEEASRELEMTAREAKTGDVDSRELVEEEESKITGSRDLHVETKGHGDGPNSDLESKRMGSLLMTSPNSEVFTYEHFDVKKYAKSVGFSEEVDQMCDFVDGMGIEEFNVFAQTCAFLASGPDVGLNNKIIDMYSVETLMDEEKDIIEELKDAQEELDLARAKVVALDDDTLVDPDSNLLSSSGFGILSLTNSNEWRICEKEYEESLQFLESKSENEPKGKCRLFKSLLTRIFSGPDNLDSDPKYSGLEPDNVGKAFETDIDHPSYAVVTFSSRHSAIVARQCLADGRANNNWKQVDDIPIYPLADAPPLMLFPFFPRGFMRPVTPTITYTSKKIRYWITMMFLLLFTGFYTIPITRINEYLLSPDVLAKLFGIPESFFSKFSSTLSSMTLSLLLSICPSIFRFVAYKEGVSSSMGNSEQRAMMFFWYFFLVARFMGPLLYSAIRKIYNGSVKSLEEVIYSSMTALATTVPTTLGPFLLTYIIFMATISFPTIYFLQLMNFVTSMFRLRWINRLLKGGGPGIEVPYRIYIDGGFVFACMIAIAPLCPLVGLVGILYFAIVSPMLRWLMVFTYRPRWDGGGDKWPNLHYIIITSLLLGQLITAITFVTKGNVFAGVIIFFCIIPTLMCNNIILEKFLRPYSDASLKYTGKLNNEEEGEDAWPEREEFRRWLVDCHKASYLPTCLSGGTKNLLTAEPAMVVPKVTQTASLASHPVQTASMRSLLSRQETQKGGIGRRHRYGI